MPEIENCYNLVIGSVSARWEQERAMKRRFAELVIQGGRWGTAHDVGNFTTS